MKIRTLLFSVGASFSFGVQAQDSSAAQHPENRLETPRNFELIGTQLTSDEVRHLAVLGKIWGFLKYHHPRITSGSLSWDDELLKALPSVIAAGNDDRRNAMILAWVKGVGDPLACDVCTTLPQDPHLLADLDWIHDAEELGEGLATYLESVYQNRPSVSEQYYARPLPGRGNADFSQEHPYPDMRPPAADYRILALFRFWNVIQYWFPYRDLIENPWESVLLEFLPRLAAADDGLTYRRELLALVAQVGDSHANVWNATNVRPPSAPRSACAVPVVTRFVENRLTVTGYMEGPEARSGLNVGDVVLSLNDTPIEQLVTGWEPYYAASNRASRMRDIGLMALHGPCGVVSLGFARGGAVLDIQSERIRLSRRDLAVWLLHDRSGDTLQMLGQDVAYLKLSTIKVADIAGYVERIQGKRGLIIDIRNYPNEFVLFALGKHLVTERTPIAAFTVPDLSNPGVFYWGSKTELEPGLPHFEGRIVLLVDETTQSQAEYTTMALRASSKSLVVGSTTAGADGDMSTVILPGGLRAGLSGLGVFYPDRTPTQRIGIVPDVFVEPTVDGIRAGRDELLEEALRQILGPDVDEKTIRVLASR